jgi:high-affinity nickel permease
MFYRIVLITGITIISAVFVGAILLVGVLEGEKPLSGNVRNTLGADKKPD